MKTRIQKWGNSLARRIPKSFAAETRLEQGIEVRIPSGLGVRGVVLADQVKSLDWRLRRAELICALPSETVAEILTKLTLLLTDPV